MKITHIISLVLIALFLNLELANPGGKHSEPVICGCSVNQGICGNTSDRCCCSSANHKTATSSQDTGHYNKSDNQSADSFIYSPDCGDNQTKTLPPSTAKSYIVTKHIALEFNQTSFLYRPFFLQIPVEQFVSPPYKPPRNLS